MYLFKIFENFHLLIHVLYRTISIRRRIYRRVNAKHKLIYRRVNAKHRLIYRRVNAKHRLINRRVNAKHKLIYRRVNAKHILIYRRVNAKHRLIYRRVNAKHILIYRRVNVFFLSASLFNNTQHPFVLIPWHWQLNSTLHLRLKICVRIRFKRNTLRMFSKGWCVWAWSGYSRAANNGNVV